MLSRINTSCKKKYTGGFLAQGVESNQHRERTTIVECSQHTKHKMSVLVDLNQRSWYYMHTAEHFGCGSKKMMGKRGIEDGGK
jgi:hypothetical protein